MGGRTGEAVLEHVGDVEESGGVTDVIVGRHWVCQDTPGGLQRCEALTLTNIPVCERHREARKGYHLRFLSDVVVVQRGLSELRAQSAADSKPQVLLTSSARSAETEKLLTIPDTTEVVLDTLNAFDAVARTERGVIIAAIVVLRWVSMKMYGRK